MPTYQTRYHLWRHPSSRAWYIIWQEGGKPKRKSLRTKSRGEANALLEEALRDSRKLTPSTKEISLHEAADAWLLSRERGLRNLTRTTLVGYRTFVKQLKEITPSYVIAGAVRAKDARHIVDQFQVQFQLSDSTAKKRHNALRMLYQWMMEEDMVSSNPVKLNDAPKARPKQKPALATSQYNQLQRALIEARDASESSEAKSRGAQDLLDQAELLWKSGMRSVQAQRLTWDKIDIDGLAWVVSSPGQNKGGEGVQPIHKDLQSMLRRRQLLGETGPFQPAGRMKYLWRKWKEKNPEFKGWSWHQMRSRVVTELKRMKEDEASKALVGHTNDTTSDLYTHLGIEDHREALNRL